MVEQKIVAIPCAQQRLEEINTLLTTAELSDEERLQLLEEELSIQRRANG